MIIKFFITPVYPYGNDHYYHEIISVAEGFTDLGYDVIANANYWWQPEKEEYLLKEDLLSDFDIGIYDYRYARSFEHLLFRKGYPNLDKSKIHVLVDRNDWISPFWLENKHYQVFDLICAGNLYKAYNYPSNVKPWAISLTNRIMSYIDKSYDENKEVENVIGYNFRVSHNMRGYVFKQIEEQETKYPVVSRFTDSIQQTDIDLPDADRLYWKQSTKRHNPAYYEILNDTLIFLSFGGYYETRPLIYQPYSLKDKIIRKPRYWKYKKLKDSSKDFSDEIFIFQHDNFRFWEVLYSRAVAVNIDLNYWGFWMPEMPEKGKHYLGIEKLNAQSFVHDVNNLSVEELKTIGINGRKWVDENYSPKANANRILSYLKDLKKL